MRRNSLNPFFSMSTVRSLQPVMQERIDVVMGRMKEFIDKDKVLNATYMLAAYTNDIVETYCFGKCQHRIGKSCVSDKAKSITRIKMSTDTLQNDRGGKF